MAAIRVRVYQRTCACGASVKKDPCNKQNGSLGTWRCAGKCKKVKVVTNHFMQEVETEKVGRP